MIKYLENSLNKLFDQKRITTQMEVKNVCFLHLTNLFSYRKVLYAFVKYRPKVSTEKSLNQQYLLLFLLGVLN